MEKPMSIWMILWEGLKLPTRNLKLIIPILLLTIITSSCLFLSNYYIINSLIKDITTNLYPNPPSPPKDLKPLITKLIIIEFVSMIIFFTISVFLFITLASATAITYLTPGLKLPELLARVKQSWKGPFITNLLVTGLNLACMLLIMAMFTGFFFLISNNKLALILLGVALLLLVLFLFVRLSVVWSFAILVSVIEDGCYGMKAILRSKELSEGRKRQLIRIALVMAVPVGAFSGVTNTANSVVWGLLTVILMRVLSVVMIAAYTVFYYDCKKCRGEDIILSQKEGVLYTSLSTKDCATYDVV